jgi:hypothetical protein
MTQLKGFVKKGDDQIYGMQVFWSIVWSSLGSKIKLGILK